MPSDRSNAKSSTSSARLFLRAVNAVDEMQHPALAARHAIAQRERLAGGGAAVDFLPSTARAFRG